MRDPEGGMSALPRSRKIPAFQETTPLRSSGSAFIVKIMPDLIALKNVLLGPTFVVWFGCAMLLLIATMAAAVFIFRVPVKDEETGEAVPTAVSAKIFVILGASSLLLVAAGLIVNSGWVVPSNFNLLTSIPSWGYVIFVLLSWLFVTSILNRSAGWPELMRSFARPTGKALFTQKLKWAVMGKGVTCKNVITIAAHDAGVVIDQSRWFGPFTSAVLVPWDQVNVGPIEGAAHDLISLKFGELEKAALVLPSKCWMEIDTHRPAKKP